MKLIKQYTNQKPCFVDEEGKGFNFVSDEIELSLNDAQLLHWYMGKQEGDTFTIEDIEEGKRLADLNY